MAPRPSIGLCFHRELPARLVIDQAKAAEQLGYDQLWVIEDCFFTAGPSLAAAALTATSSITVGIGILPAAARNPAIAAMEIATLCQLGPGRFHPGIGHGMPEWMAQIGEARPSPVTMLSETLDAVRRLLHGERLEVSGRYVQLDGVELAAPPEPPPPVLAGVRGPRSIAAAGQVADGVVLADFVSPAYVRSALELMASPPSRPSSPLVTAFATMAVDPDGDEMRRIAATVAAGSFAAGFASVRSLPFYDDVARRAERVGWVDALAALPAQDWRQMGAIGTPDDAVAYLEAMGEAGTDCVAIFPDPEDPIASAAAFARDVLAHLPR